jgi:hypothetical protein
MLGRISLIALLLFYRLGAQTSTGTINGTVLDSSGAVIPNAKVRLIGTETGDLARDLTTDGSGTFAAPLLKPSIYNVEVTAQGFKRLLRKGITLRVDDTLNLKLTLETGVATESITVAANAELLEEKSNTVGQVIDDKSIQQLPLNGRNYLQLGNLSAGAVPNTRTRDRSFSAYGNRGLQNAFLLDGARNQNYMRGMDNRARDAMRPSLEAISEFKVQTSNYSAEYGASAGAVVNVVTKSGTNEFHGSVFEFVRNNAFDARDYFLPSTSKQPPYQQHQYGGGLGGPIKRNRAWFQGAFQRTTINQGDTGTATIPLASERAGVFALPIYDPATTRANPAGTGSVRDLFPNRTVPAARFDRIGKSIIDRFPDPNLPGTARNWTANPFQSQRANNATFRGDLKVTDRDTLFGRYSLDSAAFLANAILPEPAQTPVNRDQPSRSWGIGYTRIVSNNKVNDLRIAYNYVGLIQDALMAKNEVISGSLAPRIDSSIPTFGIAGYATIGEQPANFGNNPVDKKSRVWNFSDNFSWVKGKHTMKFGFDMQYLDVPTFAALQGRGSWGFSGVFTQNPQARPNSGSSVADLLLGLPNTITIGSPSDANERARNYYGYFQDDFNLSPKLTLNIGVRYEITAPFYDANDRLANLVIEGGSPLNGQYMLAGDSRLPRALQTTDRNNWAPRVGFAYRGPKNVVLRGGFGIFFAQDEGFGVSQRMTNNPPFVGFGGFNVTSDQLNPSSTIPLSSALPARPAPIDPKTFVLNPLNTVQLRSWPTRNTIPYVQQWNLSLQKDVFKNTVFELNYVGNHGVKLYGAYEGNQPIPGPGAVNNRRPLRGILTSGSVLSVAPWVNSTYHGLSARLERRFAQGFNLLAVYTFGRALDTQTTIDLCDGCAGSSGSGAVTDARNRSLNYGLGDHHTAHRFVLSGLWELPFAKRNIFLGGWALSGITTLSTGIPTTATLNFDNANTGSSNWPDRLRNPRIDNPNVNRYFDTSAYAFPTPFTIGNGGRNTLLGPGIVSTDLSIQRNFALRFINEVSRLEFRGEAYNLFNTPQLGQPNAVLGNPAFGTIGGTARANRQLQLGLRLLF